MSREHLNDMIEKEILDSLAEQLTTKSQTVAVAESVTAGLITTTLSRADNATQFLQGGLTAYNLGQKCRHLQVDPIQADATNCVSETVSEEMAAGVARSFLSNWGIGVTGYAVPVPALNIHSCFAFFAFVFEGQTIKSGRVQSDLKTQAQVQEHFAALILQAFLETVRVHSL